MALPNALHFEWAKKALNAGKDVLLEKPCTSHAAEARELVALVSICLLYILILVVMCTG